MTTDEKPREADPRMDLPGTQGLGPDEGIGPSLVGQALLDDAWVQAAVALLRARRARKEG
jgi:hypothetical protein